jgi:large subunit ribosomal protein L2
MNLKKLKPFSNSSRHSLLLTKNLLCKNNKILKNLKKGIKNKSGRSSITGHITVRHQGGGVKNLFRTINFTNDKFSAIVVSILYDPKRSAFISLNFDLKKKLFFYSLNINYIFPGSFICCDSNNIDLKLGFRTVLKNIPTGSVISCLSFSKLKNQKINFIRSGGTFGQIIQKDFFSSKIKLPSSEIIEVPVLSYATIGSVSNNLQKSIVYGKAGRRRYLGKRPSVRGIAMNPVDHPHGGRTNGGRPSVTPWGIPTKGKPTVKKKNG